MGDLSKAMAISASGMKAQGTRVKVISENLANADSIGATPSEDPYRRKMVTFKSVMDRDAGVEKVTVNKTQYDNADFQKKYDPQHPAADAEGYIKTPNVNPLVEMMDMREAQRSYEANINTMLISRDMLEQTLNLINAQ